MKKFLAAFSAIVSVLMFSQSAAAQEQQCENSASVEYDTGRLFEKQGLDFYQGSTWIFDYTLACGNFYADLWRAETGHRPFNETDLRVGYADSLTDNLSYDASVALYELYGPEAYELSGEITYTINDNWSLTGDIDIVRGGFETNAFLGEVTWSNELFGNLSTNTRVGISFDTWSEDFVGHYGLGVSTPLVWGIVGSASVKGFVVLDEGDPSQSNDENANVFTLGLSRRF